MAKVAIDLHNFRVVKFGDLDIERNYVNDILHALVGETDSLQSQIDALGTGGDPTQASAIMAVPEASFPNSRVLAGEPSVISVADGGPSNSIVVGIETSGINAEKLNVIGTPSPTTVIQDDGTTLTYVEVSGSVPIIPDNTFLGNDSGGPLAAYDLDMSTATAMLDQFGPSLQGVVPGPASVAPPGSPVTYLDETGTWSLVLPTMSGGTTGWFLTNDGLNANWSALPAFPVGANPTASVGLGFTNGVAATFMRSDGAPKLDVTISPSWTGTHTFSLKINANGGLESAAATNIKAGGDLIAGSNTTGGTDIYGRNHYINPVGSLYMRDVNGGVVDVWRVYAASSPIDFLNFKIGTATPSILYQQVTAADGTLDWPTGNRFVDISHPSKITIVGGALTGSALTVGTEIRCLVQGDWTITGWTLLTNSAGILRLEVVKSTYSAYTGVTPATTMSGTTNAAGGIPRVTAGNVKNTSTDVSLWSSTTVNDGDVLAIVVNGTGGFATWYSIQLHGTKREH